MARLKSVILDTPRREVRMVELFRLRWRYTTPPQLIEAYMSDAAMRRMRSNGRGLSALTLLPASAR